MKKSVFTFGLLMSSLVMLSAMPLFSNNAAMAQGYDNYIVIIANTQQTIINMSVKQVH